MKFEVARKGTRTSNVKVRISKPAKSINFSAGFLRKYNLNKDNTKFIKQGYSEESDGLIAVSFYNEDDNTGDLLKLSFSKHGTTATCGVNALLSTFNLDILEIAGDYDEKAIEGPLEIPGFAKIGFILHPNKRNKKYS